MTSILIFTSVFLMANLIDRVSCQSPLYPYLPTSGCVLGCGGNEASYRDHFYPLFYGQHLRNLSGINFLDYEVTVYPDGVVSMGPDSDQYSFDFANQGFPYMGPGAALVAPFMADVDLSLGGKVYASSTDVRDEIMNFIRGVFPDLAGIDRIGWAMITWENVSYYGSTDPEQTNTFQAVLVAARDAELGGDYYDDDWSEYFSFAIFNYGKLTWTAGVNETSVNSNENMPGIGGQHAQVGFNSGDGEKFELPGSRTMRVLDLQTSSNVGIPGRWVYRTDTDMIQGFQCANTSGRVALAPSSGVMMGGTVVSIIGPCFTSSSVIRCSFGNQTVNGTFVGQDEAGIASCITPPCLQEGPTQMMITVDGVQFDATFTYLSPASVTPDVTRVDPVGNWYNNDEKTIRWRNTDFDVNVTTRLSIDLVGYCEGGENFLSNIHHIVDVTIMDTSYEELDPLGASMGSFCGDDGCSKIGAIRIKDIDSEQAIWSDFFLLQSFCPIDDSIMWCKEWIEESEPSNSSEIPCPCTLNQALINMAAFIPITGCGCDEERDPINCADRDCNLTCFRSRQRSPCLTNGQECCYDPADGMLLPTTDARAGYSYFAHQEGCTKSNGAIPLLSHLQKDVFPWLHCCMLGDDGTCSGYRGLRPAPSCAGYIPVTPAMCGGDPHIMTLDGTRWTFNGWGEYQMVEVSDRLVVLHARNQPITNQRATVIKAVGACEAGSDGLHIEERVGGLNVYARVRTANGSYVWEFVDFGQSKDKPFNGFRVVSGTNSFFESDQSIHVIYDSGLGLYFNGDTGDEGVISVLSTGLRPNAETRGLLGTWNGDSDDDFTDRDGNVFPPTSTTEALHAFGTSWEISDSDSCLFYRPGENHMTFTNRNYEPDYEPPVNSAVTPEMLEEVCGTDEACRFDYRVTGDVGFAELTHHVVEMANMILEQNEATPDPCPALSNPANGNVVIDSAFAGGMAVYSCNAGHALNGVSIRVCTDQATWSGNAPICVRVAPLSCVVRRPFIGIRQDVSVVIFGIPDSEDNINGVQFVRYLDTGNGVGLPPNIPSTTSFGRELEIPLSMRQRGERFGIFACKLDKDDDISIGVRTVVTSDRKGLLPVDGRVTQTVNIGERVILRVTRTGGAKRRIRWLRNGQRMPTLNGERVLTLQDVKRRDQGVYEIFQRGRRNRGLQSFIILYVRACPKGMFGEDCDSQCACVNGGYCDDITGECTCPPGFDGETCSEDYVMGRCLSDYGAPRCRGLLFCLPGKFGCVCGPGWRGIDCQEKCRKGTYGAGCTQTCDGPSCDPRTGR